MELKIIKETINGLRENAKDTNVNHKKDVKDYINGYTDALNVVEHYVEQLFEKENNILKSNEDVVKYISGQQVYIVPEITDYSLVQRTKGHTVHNVKEVSVEEVREDCFCLSLIINDKLLRLYLDKTPKELYKWVKENFIPVKEMLYAYRKS